MPSLIRHSSPDASSGPPPGGEPETILQFGAGRFLRAFLDLFVEEARRAEPASVVASSASPPRVGRVLVVQSTPGDRARRLRAAACAYDVQVRGSLGGALVDRVERVRSLSRALDAEPSWSEVLDAARRPELRAIVSNTTEKGYGPQAAESLASDEAGDAGRAPSSYPGKLLAVLRARYECGLGGLAIFPCELIERNADRLRDAVLALASRAGRAGTRSAAPGANGDGDFLDWLSRSCSWHVTLVDRIVTLPSAVSAASSLAVACEPFALFVVERDGARQRPVAESLFSHPAILETDDATPFALRKVRLLNGAHSALVEKALPRGFQTVREAVENREMRDWLEGLLFEEIVPTLEGRVEGAAEFARAVLERFENPFLEHRLEEIALHHDAKLRTRLAPTWLEHAARFDRPAPRLRELLAPHGFLARPPRAEAP